MVPWYSGTSHDASPEARQDRLREASPRERSFHEEVLDDFATRGTLQRGWVILTLDCRQRFEMRIDFLALILIYRDVTRL